MLDIAFHTSGRGWRHYLEALIDRISFGIDSGFVEEGKKTHQTRRTHRLSSFDVRKVRIVKKTSYSRQITHFYPFVRHVPPHLTATKRLEKKPRFARLFVPHLVLIVTEWKRERGGRLNAGGSDSSSKRQRQPRWRQQHQEKHQQQHR